MKRNLVLLAGVCALLVAAVQYSSSSTLASFIPVGHAVDEATQKAPDDSVLKDRIAHIENGLLPSVIVKGQPLPTMTLADRMKDLHVHGVSIAFFEKGKILWTRTYGFADVANKRPVTPETLFQAASISKPLSALAALKLVQEHKLSLDEDVNVKLRAWKVPENEFTKDQKVTLRRILSHSAGLTVHGFPGYASGEPVPTVTQILNGEKPANNAPVRVDTVPGTLWRYSGGGYVVLQLLLTDVTGKPYPQILHDLVLRPAVMTHSTYEQPLPKNLTSSAAIPYEENGEPVKGGAHTYPEMGPAGLWTTPSDLARLAIEVQNEYAGKSDKILSQAMMHEMLTHQKDDWGLGFNLYAPGPQAHFGHNGGNEGFKCELDAYTDSESNQGVVIMTNSDNGNPMLAEIRRAVAKEYGWPDFHPKEYTEVTVDPKLFDGYVGRYELAPKNVILTITREGDHLFVEAFGQPREEMFPASDRDYFLKDEVAQITFETDSKGRATGLITHKKGVDQHAKRIE